jgi:hypothetical protein
MTSVDNKSEKESPLITMLRNYGENGLKRGGIRGLDVGELLRNKYDDLLDLLSDTHSPAIIDPANDKFVSHKDLKYFIKDSFDLREFNIPYGARVSVVLPNGPFLAITMLGVLCHWCAAPINANNTLHETISELKGTKAVAVIILGDSPSGAMALEAADQLSMLLAWHYVVRLTSVTVQGLIM